MSQENNRNTSIPLDEAEQMVEDCEARESKLTEWEIDFIDSIGTRLRHGNSLTEAQETTLTKIWNRVT